MNHILITGTSRGIGRAIALKFLENGWQVTGMDRQPADEVFSGWMDENAKRQPEQTGAELSGGLMKRHDAATGIYRHIQLDILTDDLPQLEEVQILINNAGVQNSGRDIDVNLKGTIRITETYGLHPGIRSILFIASASASTGSEFPEYAASKGGVVAYMKNVALRAAVYGATSNSLSPGGVITSLNDHILEDPVLWEAVLQESMLHKWMTLEEVADWAWFLTVVNRSMTAQDVLVDNGEAARSNFIW